MRCTSFQTHCQLGLYLKSYCTDHKVFKSINNSFQREKDLGHFSYKITYTLQNSNFSKFSTTGNSCAANLSHFRPIPLPPILNEHSLIKVQLDFDSESILAPHTKGSLPIFGPSKNSIGPKIGQQSLHYTTNQQSVAQDLQKILQHNLTSKMRYKK